MNTPNRAAGWVVILMLIVALSTTGCQQDSAGTPKPTKETAKGLIIADCIVAYYQQGQSPYITQQTHAFNPQTGSLQISAVEPTGTYTYTLNKNQFSQTQEPTAFLSALPASFVNQQLATGLFYAFGAGADLLNTEKWNPAAPIKVEGQWYEPLPVGEKAGIHTTLLNNTLTHRIDLVEVTQIQDNMAPEIDVLYFYRPMPNRWLLKSYNFRYNKELETLIPMKIDVFDTRAGLASSQLIIQVEYKQILSQ